MFALSYSQEWRTLFSHWRKDLLAGISVGIVALPLALGFAITTGAPASAGLSTAIVAGFIAALFGGSNYQVSGPTGAMTVVLVPIVAKYGVQSLVALGLIAGALVIVMALLRLGRWIDSVPWEVMEGFTLGIAVIIALQQIPLIFEVSKAGGTHTLSIAFETTKSALNQPLKWSSIAIALLTLLIKRGWPHLRKVIGIKAHVPASMIAILVSTAIVEVMHLSVQRIGELPRSLPLTRDFSLPAISHTSLIIAAVEIAILAAIESLLSARVADGMAHKEIDHEQPHHDPNKELFGQGLATMAAVCCGGLPATGAIARTSVNVRSGARTRLASMIHALFLLLVVLVLAPVVSIIPTAALAGVLLGTSLRIANPRSVVEALRTTAAMRLTYVVTAVSVIAIDLIWGIVIGIALHQTLRRIKRN